MRVAGEKQPGAEEDAADRRDRARADAILKEAGRRGTIEASITMSMVGDERRLRARPAELAFERRHEHAPRVVGAERDVHQAAADERRPAAEAFSSAPAKPSPAVWRLTGPSRRASTREAVVQGSSPAFDDR